MEYALLGWPADGPTLRLDHRAFAYAGKFVTADTGKAVVREPDRAVPDEEYDREVVAAVSFSRDRVRERRLWLRYVDVRRDRRGEGLGSRLARFAVERARERGFEAVHIAVNNPFAYHAMHKAGFGFTGEEAGLAELVLSTAAPRSRSRYQAGLDAFPAGDLHEEEVAFRRAKADAGPPDVVADPGA